MQQRSYTTRDLIQLPRLSARQAVVLLTEVMTAAAQAKKDLHLKAFPKPIERAHGRLEKAHDELAQLLTPKAKEGDTQAKRKADRAVDGGWAALFSWLDGWCQLPPERNPHRDQALALRDLVFATGLEFTQLPYKIEWHESKVRLDAIERDGHEATIAKLGGKVFLEHLREAQAKYGEAIGVTEVLQEATEKAIRVQQMAALDALRLYVTRAASHADPEEPGSEELADRLLSPIVRWESAPAGAAEGAGTEDAPAGAATPHAPAAPAAPPAG
ncbi:MAG: hypothetical protein U0441_31500 [Polyangiaceae bacterium]